MLLLFRPMRILFLLAGFLLGQWVATGGQRFDCRQAGGTWDQRGFCVGAVKVER